ncbi:unnamed protein product [Prorocentrum cordatum]|uniref:Uncharacterized protein n=1 Tax=Prorocentrum cordatum TaxID=2364126 RepID=A0ABN9VDS4_9DINO|nr:unnamed protein product [Polarella glacialis]
MRRPPHVTTVRKSKEARANLFGPPWWSTPSSPLPAPLALYRLSSPSSSPCRPRLLVPADLPRYRIQFKPAPSRDQGNAVVLSTCMRSPSLLVPATPGRPPGERLHFHLARLIVGSSSPAESASLLHLQEAQLEPRSGCV